MTRGEEEVAELLGRAVGLGLGRGSGAVELGLQLGELVLEVGERARDVGVLEADRRRAPLHLARVQQRRAAISGTSWKIPSRPSCSRLHRLPALA